jgi:hypothetical protein
MIAGLQLRISKPLKVVVQDETVVGMLITVVDL